MQGDRTRGCGDPDQLSLEWQYRNQHKADAAAQRISKTVGPWAKVHAYAADMTSLRQVRDLAQRVRADHPSIDILINNAGKNPVFPPLFISWQLKERQEQ